VYKQTRVKRLICLLFVMSTSQLSGCWFNNYFRDYSKDYVNEKEDKPLMIPKYLDLVTPEQSIQIPAPATNRTAPLQPNKVPLPVYSVTDTDNTYYRMVDTSVGIVIQSNADFNLLWNSMLSFLQLKSFAISYQNKASKMIISDWVTTKKNAKKGIMTKVVHRFSKKSKHMSEVPLKLLFSLETVAGVDGWQIAMNLQHAAASSHKSIKKQLTVSEAKQLDDLRQAFFTYLIQQKEIAKAPERVETEDAKSLALLTTDHNGQPVLKIKNSFDAAWNITRQALEEAGVSIKGENYNAGIYYIHLFPNKVNAKTDNIISPKQLFGIKGSDEIQKAPVYRLVLSPENEEVYLYLEKNTETRATAKLSEIVLDKIWSQF